MARGRGFAYNWRLHLARCASPGWLEVRCWPGPARAASASQYCFVAFLRGSAWVCEQTLVLFGFRPVQVSAEKKVQKFKPRRLDGQDLPVSPSLRIAAAATSFMCESSKRMAPAELASQAPPKAAITKANTRLRLPNLDDTRRDNKVQSGVGKGGARNR